MRRLLLACLLLPAVGAAGAADGPVLDAMDEIHFHAPKDRGEARSVEGKFGRAVRFSFADGARSAFFTSNLRGTPAWDRAAGLSFWVKGDGSDHFGCLQ